MLPGALEGSCAQAKVTYRETSLGVEGKAKDEGHLSAASSPGTASDAGSPAASPASAAESDCHGHCPCVLGLIDRSSELEDALEAESQAHDQTKEQLANTNVLLTEAKEEVAGLRQHLEKHHDFSLQAFARDDVKIRYYTGFFTFGLLMACFRYLEESAKSMRSWQGKRTRSGERPSEKTGAAAKLSLEDQFFLVLVRLRLGLAVQDLADRFSVSPTTVSRTFISWINLMVHKFAELPLWMSRKKKVTKLMPPCFKTWYPSTRTIIDGTEFFIERPSNLACQSATWSSYKNHNTLKALVCISPDGTITFVSSLYEGSISDVELVQQCGLLSLLEAGDSTHFFL